MFVFVSCVSQITNIIFMLIIPFFINLAWWEEYIEHQPHDHHVIKLYVYQPWRHLAWWEEYALSPSHILPSWWTDLIFRVVFFGGKTKMNFHNIKICFPASFLSAITLLGMPAEVYTQVMKLLVISFSLWITLLNQIYLMDNFFKGNSVLDGAGFHPNDSFGGDPSLYSRLSSASGRNLCLVVDNLTFRFLDIELFLCQAPSSYHYLELRFNRTVQFFTS